ncbi:DUF4062 domain-containing protein [Paraburkholderia sediminicola]|uniref:DUF4062 domain-containing protein n=1 Tax=Paraburkholderia sediminicola TaxID=458836 RepID=UPI0038BC5A4A
MLKRKLQIFISSTFTDLVPDRQAAVGAVLKAGHIPAGMELFTAGDRSQMVTIRQWIDESDVYMLILGGRYGSVEKTSGLSYTELEYDYAVQQGKPIFAVVIKESALEARVREGGTAFIEREHPKELELFREKVLSNISSFFEDPKDIKLCVHESLADFAASRDLKGWVSADEVTDTRTLVEEIKRLSDENRSLKEALARLEKKTAAQGAVDAKAAEFEQLAKILRAIEITVPAKASGKEDFKITLVDLFHSNKETFVNGVTNAAQVSDAESWLYHSICPKLQVHGLMVNEKVAGVRYRRSSVSSRGQEFLAFMERTLLLAKEPEQVARSHDTPQSESESASASPHSSGPQGVPSASIASKPKGRQTTPSKSKGTTTRKAGGVSEAL